MMILAVLMIRQGKEVIMMKILAYNFLFFIDLLRYAAYRQFRWWIHTCLGKGVRRITQMVFIQGLKKILKSPKQDVHGS